jgi:large subunit ribosomal protein L10
VLREKKEIFITQLQEIFSKSAAVFVIHYHGLKVTEISSLRNRIKEKNGSVLVPKNTLAKISLSDTDYREIVGMFKGPTAIIYTEDDPVGIAKVLDEFAKSHQAMKIVGGAISQDVFDESGVKQLAKLPSMDELRAKIISVIATPARNIASILQEPHKSTIRVINSKFIEN